MLTRLTIVLLFVATAIVSARSSIYNVNLDSVLTVLDREIAMRDNYNKAKEAHIASVRNRLSADDDDVDNFRVLEMLYEEFRQYQSDSAFYYSNRLDAIADKSGDNVRKAIALTTKFDYYTSVWLLDEAMAQYKLIDESLLPLKDKLNYYQNCEYLMFRLSLQAAENDSDTANHYTSLYNHYLGRIVDLSTPGTYIHEMHRLDREEEGGVSAEDAIRRRLELLSKFDFGDHERAMLYASIGGRANEIGDARFEAYCIALSAIHDIRSSTHETASVYTLANLMNQFGDTERAVRYIRVAFDDALFFNSRLKQYQTGMILPLIESMRYDHLSSQRRLMAILLVLITLLLCVSGTLVVKLFRRNSRLEKMRLLLNDTQLELVKANDSLSTLNSKLKETIALKDSYIIQSLYINTSFLKQVESRCHEAINDMKTKGLEAMRFLPYQMGIKEERQRIMASFDHTFLQVFPNFIDDFNALLADGESISLGEDNGLSTELRIFALMRLGVTDTAAVSDFLNISANSIYVYKARIKAKSNLSKTEFDARVMAITKPD